MNISAIEGAPYGMPARRFRLTIQAHANKGGQGTWRGVKGTYSPFETKVYRFNNAFGDEVGLYV